MKGLLLQAIVSKRAGRFGHHLASAAPKFLLWGKDCRISRAAKINLHRKTCPFVGTGGNNRLLDSALLEFGMWRKRNFSTFKPYRQPIPPSFESHLLGYPPYQNDSISSVFDFDWFVIACETSSSHHLAGPQLLQFRKRQSGIGKPVRSFVTSRSGINQVYLGLTESLDSSPVGSSFVVS